MTASHTRRIKITRQRLTTTDENAAKAYQDKMTLDLARAVCGDDGNRSGIIRGCGVSVVGATMTVAVQPGLGLYYDSASGAPDSAYRLLEVNTAIQATLDAGDPQPRWDLIEIQPNSVDGTAETVDFWDPVLGTFIAASASPLKVSSPTVQIVKGTASATPKFPTPTDGFIPLGYVYVPGGAVVLSQNDVLHCRPILRATGEFMDPQPYVLPYKPSKVCTGGGLYAIGGTLTPVLVNQMEGYFELSHTKFMLPRPTQLGVEFGIFDGGGLPLADTILYFYAIPAPLPGPPTDPNFLAPREFFTVNANNVAFGAGGYKAGMQGCIYVYSTVAPTADQQGAPIGGGIAAFTGHPIFGNFNSDRSGWYYIGSCMFDFGSLEIVKQEISGDRIMPVRKCGKQISTLIPILGATSVNLTTEVAGNPSMTLPPHAFDLVLRIGHTTGAAVAETKVAFYDLGGDSALLGSSRRVAGLVEPGTLALTLSSAEFVVTPDSSGDITVDYADTSGIPDVLLRVESYRDAILAMR